MFYLGITTLLLATVIGILGLYNAGISWNTAWPVFWVVGVASVILMLIGTRPTREA